MILGLKQSLILDVNSYRVQMPSWMFVPRAWYSRMKTRLSSKKTARIFHFSPLKTISASLLYSPGKFRIPNGARRNSLLKFIHESRLLHVIRLDLYLVMSGQNFHHHKVSGPFYYIQAR